MTANSSIAPGLRRARSGRTGLARRALDSEQFNGWAFVTPGAAIILLFGAVPIVWSAVMSFQKSSLAGSTPFVGLSNYRRMVHDPIVLFLDERRGDPRAVSDLYGRLDVDPTFRPPAAGDPVNESRAPRPELDEGLLHRLREYYHQSDRALSDLLGRELPWSRTT